MTQKQNVEISYLFAGHCYQYGSGGTKIDFRLEQLDVSAYTGVWLGGDVCSEATLEFSTMQYLDDLFQLDNEEMHWTLGNHDARNMNWEYYRELSGRNTFYAFSSNGLTRIVLNTNIVPMDCESLDNQYAIIENVCDSIQESNYLILLMHHGLWEGIPGLPPPQTYANSNLRYWNSNCYDVNSTFVNSIYPLLVEVQSRGVQVLCILGDMGVSTKTFDMLSDDGIRFLGCGLYDNEAEDKVLILKYQPESQFLDYGFHNLDSLLLHQ